MMMGTHGEIDKLREHFVTLTLAVSKTRDDIASMAGAMRELLRQAEHMEDEEIKAVRRVLWAIYDAVNPREAQQDTIKQSASQCALAFRTEMLLVLADVRRGKGLTRKAAAELLAPLVGMNVEDARKALSQHFPGAQWKSDDPITFP